MPAYGAFASRVNRVQLVRWVTLFFVANLALFLLALNAGLRIGIVYFLWVGIFNVMVIAQFWAFANDLYTQEQGKRLFPLIGVGSSLGAWVGSVRAGYLLESVGPQRLLLVGAVILTCLRAVVARGRPRDAREAKRISRRKPGKRSRARQSGFGMILSDRYLMLIAVLTVLLNVVNTSGEYLFGRYVVDTAKAMYGDGPASQAAREQFIGTTYSSYFSYVNLIGFLLQMFVVSRVFKFLGVGKALVHPPDRGAERLPDDAARAVVRGRCAG